MHKKIMIIPMMALIICGCQKKSYEITFKKNMILDYNSNASPLECIESVGKEKNIKKHISKNGKEMKIDNVIITWSGDFTTARKGVYSVTFTTNMAEEAEQRKSIYVQDLSAPVIKLTQNEISVPLDKFKDFRAEDYYSVEDNSNEDVSVKTDYEKNPPSSGDYNMKITAADSSGNISGRSLIIHVTDAEKPEPEKTKKEQNDEQESASSKKETGKSYKQSKPAKKKNAPARNTDRQEEAKSVKRKISAKNRYFAFTNASDMQATYRKALAYAQSQLNNGKAQSYNVTPVQGSDGIYTGYSVTFN